MIKNKPQAQLESVWHENVALAAQEIVRHCKPCEQHPYLTQHQLPAYNALTLSCDVVMTFNANMSVSVVAIPTQLNMSLSDDSIANAHFLHISKGTLVFPMIDIEKRLWNIEFLKGGNREMLQHGRELGLFHFIGKAAASDSIALTTNYEMGAITHLASGWACANVYSAANLAPVAAAFRAALPNHRLIFPAPTKFEEQARQAAAEVDGIVVLQA